MPIFIFDWVYGSLLFITSSKLFAPILSPYPRACFSLCSHMFSEVVQYFIPTFSFKNFLTECLIGHQINYHKCLASMNGNEDKGFDHWHAKLSVLLLLFHLRVSPSESLLLPPHTFGRVLAWVWPLLPQLYCVLQIFKQILWVQAIREKMVEWLHCCYKISARLSEDHDNAVWAVCFCRSHIWSFNLCLTLFNQPLVEKYFNFKMFLKLNKEDLES